MRYNFTEVLQKTSFFFKNQCLHVQSFASPPYLSASARFFPARLSDPAATALLAGTPVFLVILQTGRRAGRRGAGGYYFYLRRRLWRPLRLCVIGVLRPSIKPPAPSPTQKHTNLTISSAILTALVYSAFSPRPLRDNSLFILISLLKKNVFVRKILRQIIKTISAAFRNLSGRRVFQQGQGIGGFTDDVTLLEVKEEKIKGRES